MLGTWYKIRYVKNDFKYTLIQISVVVKSELDDVSK